MSVQARSRERILEGCAGSIVGWLSASLLAGKLLAEATNTHTTILKFTGALLCGVLAFSLPALLARQEQKGLNSLRAYKLIRLIAAAVVGSYYYEKFDFGCISAPVALFAAAASWFILITIAGDQVEAPVAVQPTSPVADTALTHSRGTVSERAITPVAHGLTARLIQLVGIVLCGGATGFCAGIYRVIGGWEHAESNSAGFCLFIPAVAGTSIGLRLLFQAAFGGRESIRKGQLAALIADGFLTGLIIGVMTSVPPYNTNFLGKIAITGNVTWLVVGPIIGFLIGSAGGVVRILISWLVGYLPIPGSLRSSLRLPDLESRIDEGKEPENGGSPSTARPPARQFAPTSGRAASCCLAPLSLVALLAVAFIGKMQTGTIGEDIPKIPQGCPPRCNGMPFAGKSLEGVDFTSADLTDADLSGAFLNNARLNDATLKRANLLSAHLNEADLTGADLTEAKMEGAVLFGARLKNTNLTRSKLCRASLQGVDLSSAKLQGADLTKAVFNKFTIWPPGYDPLKAGARKDE